MLLKEAKKILKQHGFICETYINADNHPGNVIWYSYLCPFEWGIGPDELLDNLTEDSPDLCIEFKIEINPGIDTDGAGKTYYDDPEVWGKYKITNLEEIPEEYKPYLNQIMDEYIDSKAMWNDFDDDEFFEGYEEDD